MQNMASIKKPMEDMTNKRKRNDKCYEESVYGKGQEMFSSLLEQLESAGRAFFTSFDILHVFWSLLDPGLHQKPGP